MTLQDRYDDAMFDFTQGNYDAAAAKFRAILAEDPAHFDAQLSLGMTYYRKGEFSLAIEEGHKAEQMKPNEQLVHTNLSLFYMKAGDKTKAEHHGLQARIASWKTPQEPTTAPSDPALELSKPPPPPTTVSAAKPKVPDMPWKTNPRVK